MKPILENWRRFLKEDKRVVTAYHGSNVPIKNFSRDHGAQGVMWFSEDRDKIIRGESGALSSKYIMKVELNVDRTTGWQDYDKKFLKQIEDEGYDSIQLDDDWIVFDPARVKVVGIENRLNERNYQKDSEAIKTHSKRKKKLVGKGKNKTKAAPFTKKASMKRSKSAPPGFGALSEEPEQLELPLPFRLPQEVLKGANEPVLVKNIPMAAITMLKSQGESVLRDILVKMEPSRTEGLPELWYDTSKKQLIVDDGNHRIFQRWLAGEDKFDAMVYGSDWNSQLRSVYPGEEVFDWSEKYRQQ